MEKYSLRVVYFILGIVVGYFGFSFNNTANISKDSKAKTISYNWTYSLSKDLYKSPRKDDLYFFSDSLSLERTVFRIFKVDKDSVTFIKLEDDVGDNMTVNVMILNNLGENDTQDIIDDQEIEMIAKDQLSSGFSMENSRLIDICRYYLTTKIENAKRIFFSPYCIFILLLSLSMIWFGTNTSDFVGNYADLFPRVVNISILTFIFYLLNPVNFTYRIFAVLFSILSIVPNYLFFQRFKDSLFLNYSWLAKEAYKFVLIVVIGFLFQYLFYKICIVMSFELSDDPFEYIHNISKTVAQVTGLLWLFIGAGNFLNNARRYLVDVKNKEQELQSNAQQSKAELDALQSKVNPHFLYNSLNSIAGLAQEDPEKTEEMAIALSHFYKQSTNRQGEHWNTIGEALELLQTYLDIEKIRFGERLQFDLVCPATVKEEKIPRFLLQPLVENAIKYGYQSITNSIDIRLEIKKEGEQLTFLIFDKGQPFPDNLQSGYGVQSVQKKLELLYPDRHELAFINAPEKRVVITLDQVSDAQVSDA